MHFTLCNCSYLCMKQKNISELLKIFADLVDILKTMF